MVTTERRLEAIEASLTPTQSVLRWLNEAHAYGSLEANVDATLDQKLDDFPANRLCREAERSARATVGSRSPEQVNRAIHKARRETLFRFELVNRINVTAHEVLEKEELLRTAALAFLALLAGQSEQARRGAAHRETLERTLEILLGRVTELEAAGQARMLAEQRYLDSSPVLFPDVRGAWDEECQATKEAAAMAFRLAELDGVDLPQPSDADAISARAAVLLADLVEPAKAIALEKLGEGESALRIATSWLRAKLDRSRAATEPDSSPEDSTL